MVARRATEVSVELKWRKSGALKRKVSAIVVGDGGRGSAVGDGVGGTAKTWRRALAGLGVLAGLAAIAVGCGEETPEATFPVVLGYLSVAESDSDDYYKVVSMAADHINLAGGVDGAAIVVIPRDTEAEPEVGKDAALELFRDYGAIGIVGPQTSLVTVAVAEAASIPNKRLIISPSATSPVITTLDDDDYVYRVAMSDELQGKVLADLAWEEGYKHVAVIYVNDPYGAGLSEQFSETFTELGGRTTMVSHEHDRKETFKAELEEASAGGAEVLLPIGHRRQTDVYLPEALEGGYFSQFLFPDAAKSPDLLELVGWEALEGSLGSAPGSPPGRPEYQAFREAFSTHYGKEYPKGGFLAEHYDAAVLLGLAAAKAGTTTDFEALRDALREVAGPGGEKVSPGREGIARALELIARGEEINYEGASGAVDFDEFGDVVETIEIWQVLEGEIRSTGRFLAP